MRRVVHPVCDRCNKTNPEFESARWSIRVCYACAREIADWLDERGWLESNPLVQELLDGVFSGGTVPLANQYTVVVKSHMGTNAYAYRVINRIDLDS